MSKLEANTIDTVSGTTNLTIGSTNTSTITMPNGKLTGQNYPSFLSTRTSTQTISDETSTTVQFNNVIVDTNSGFSTSTYKYTIPTAGKYYIFTTVQANSPGNTDGFERMHLKLLKNSDVLIGESYYDQRNNPGFFSTLVIVNTHDLSANDTIFVQCFVDVTNGGSDPQIQGEASPRETCSFGAYRLGA